MVNVSDNRFNGGQEDLIWYYEVIRWGGKKEDIYYEKGIIHQIPSDEPGDVIRVSHDKEQIEKFIDDEKSRIKFDRKKAEDFGLF